MKKLTPTSSYSLVVPEDAVVDFDSEIVSVWRPGQHLLLQLSSKARFTGEQVDAATRLKERILSGSGSWEIIDLRVEHFDDCAAAKTVDDEQGFVWIHAYVVSPVVAVYATISGPPDLMFSENSWALTSLKTLAPVIN